MVDVWSLGAAALIGVGLLLSALLTPAGAPPRSRLEPPNCIRWRSGSSNRCKTSSATNARLNESEARYKGLVDAQGDAIFRRAPTAG